MVMDSAWNTTTQTYGHKGVTLFHIVALITGIINFLLNGLIWLAFASNQRLLSKSHLYLFYAFAVTNSLTGFFTIPTYINLIIHNNYLCPRWTILIGSSFEIGLDRMRSVMTLAIAGDRVHALWRPGDHYFLDHEKVAYRICLFGAIWSIIDATAMISEDNIFVTRFHCVTTSSSGPIFHLYFLISAIFFGLLLAFVYFMFICKLFVVKETRLLQLNRNASKENFNQANSLTVTVIMMVLIFSVLPSSLYLYDMIKGEVLFMQWGPIITIGYHCYGIMAFFFYNWKHRHIRNALKNLMSAGSFPWIQRLMDSRIRLEKKKSTRSSSIRIHSTAVAADEVFL